MIINCPYCEKKFQISNDLIPSNGRLLQCGSCKKSWFFKPKNITENITNEQTKIDQSIKKEDKEITFKKKKEINRNNLKDKTPKNYELTKYKKNTTFSFSKFLSFLIVLIITFIALIIIIDTFKNPLYSTFPNLEVLMFSYFETLTDIKLFIKDLLQL